MKASRKGVRPAFSLLWQLGLLLGASFTGQAAQAQNCTTDEQCGPGYQCRTYEDTLCSGSACRRGETCPPPVCETRISGYCENADCSSDADCPDPMLCHVESYEECSEEDRPACKPGVPCTLPEPSKPTCTSHTRSSCKQPYELPCTSDADCGGGFRCVEEVFGWCSGSGKVLPDGGVVEVEEECGETRTGQFRCELQVLPCEADSECPSGLTCQDNWQRPSCPVGRDAGTSVRDAGVATDAGTPPSNGGEGTPTPSDLPASADDVGEGSDESFAAEPIEEPSYPDCTGLPPAPERVCRPPERGGSSGPDYPVDPTEPNEPPPDGEEQEGSARDAGAAKPGDGDNAGEGSSGGKDVVRRRGRKIRKIIEAVRQGCSVSEARASEQASAFDLSWFALAGLFASAARRKRSAAR